MTEDDLTALLSQQEKQFESMSTKLMESYMTQYQELVQKSMEDMQKMIKTATQQAEEVNKPAEVHMKWAEVNDQHVLIMSEKAGKDILRAFDVLAELLPQLDKLLKQKRTR